MERKIINFDNSASSFPKPAAVSRATANAIEKYGGNPGRGGHKLSIAASEQIYKVRKSAAEFFGAKTENTAFTCNCTFALNMAIKGIMQYGGHIIISDYEHNACARPVYSLWKNRGIEYSIAQIMPDTEQTLNQINRLINKNTKCICMTAASNVTGRILPYKEIARLCKEKGLCFIADCAQAGGLLDISLEDGFNFICLPGHKALYGPSGTGLLISDGEFPLSTIVEGGTGATSAMLEQTPFMPEKLESGSINTAGIIGFGAGLNFVKSKGVKRIHAYEKGLCEIFSSGLREMECVTIYDSEYERVPIVAFNLGDMDSSQTAELLSERGFALRGGLQCAALAHRHLGTTEGGVVRFSPSVFNNKSQVYYLLAAIRSINSENR